MAGARAVIAGFGGDLITHAYVEQELLPAVARTPSGGLPEFERQFARWWRQASRLLGPASSVRSIFDVAVVPLLQLLDHGRPAAAAHPLGLSGRIAESGITVITVPWDTPLRAAWRDAVARGAGEHASWAIASNGRALRIVDCTRAWTRLAVEFEFEHIVASPRGIATFWLLARAGAMRDGSAGSLRARVIASDAHATRVCDSLGAGVLDALPRLASALSSNRAHRDAAAPLDQALTVIYRILFLLFAEARGAVPVWHEVYRDAYTIESLAKQAGASRVTGLWAALQAISRLAHAGCKAGDLEVTAFNGRLFSPRHAPLVEQRRVPDAVVRDVLLALVTTRGPHGRRPISYHDLGVEQLGSVYERVLDYEPRAGTRAIALSKTSRERKATGSFYTPRTMTEFLVRRTLGPLVEGKTADQLLDLRVVDPAMGSGAFLVAACRYLSEQCEHAFIAEGRWSASEVTGADRASLRRQVAERCLYGVDLNPTAVQVARLSMWLTTLAADRPLTFLDHHLVAGNSLVGARLDDVARPQSSRGSAGGARSPSRESGTRPGVSLPLLDDQLADAVALRVLPARLRLALTPSDSLAVVKDKERTLAALHAADAPIAQWSLAADLWCAARLWPGTAPAAGLVTEWLASAIGAPTTLPAARLRESMREGREVARRHGVFHWELAFPEVFFDDAGRLKPDGGFDAVLGNPPWDMVRADAGSPADRDAARSLTAAVARFYRASRDFSLQGGGHTNRYQLFLERALRLTRPSGRVGLILPSGIATDHGSAPLRRHLLDRTTIDTWIGFDNRRRIFPIHRSMRFVVMTAANAGHTSMLNFRCGLTDPESLDSAAPTLTISRSRLAAWSPDDLAIPEITDAASLAIVNGIVERVPHLSDPAGWNMRFGRELNATDDRAHFVPLTPARRRGREPLLPIVEGKLLSPFRTAIDRASTGITAAAAGRLIDRDAVARERLAYRDVASATNKLTLIAAMLPAGVVSTHTVFVSKSPLDPGGRWCLLGLMNSLVANFLVRLQVTTHVTVALMARLPVPRPPEGSPAFNELVSLSRGLATTGPDADPVRYARLNAIAAALYGLSADDYEHVVKTFPLIDARIRSTSVEMFRSLRRPVLPRLQ